MLGQEISGYIKLDQFRPGYFRLFQVMSRYVRFVLVSTG